MNIACAVLYSSHEGPDKSSVLLENPTYSTIQHLADNHKVIAYLLPRWKVCSRWISIPSTNQTAQASRPVPKGIWPDRKAHQ
jgi:hypothetical protein